MFIRIARTVCFVVAAISATSSCVNAQLVIDDFAAGNNLFTFGPSTVTQITTSAGILGGERVDSLTLPNLGGAEFFGVAGFGSNGLELAQGANDQISGSFLYDDFANFDITQGGVQFAFELQGISTSSLTPLSNVLSITVGSGASTSTVFVDVPEAAAGPSDVLVNFSEFSGVDFSNVDSISLNYDFASAAGAGLTIGRFAAVPEPASTAVCVAIAGLFALRRRRSVV